MLSDHTGVLRPCVQCGVPVLHATTGQGIDEREFTLDPTSGPGGERWVSRGTGTQRHGDRWRLCVVQGRDGGYQMHMCARKEVPPPC